ncbi:NAD(P)-dependent oxidoreductase [Apilactobacillus micheneri]|uniref:NAD(P)-dependent oxidoreductase n=1 Tax=Apilactobacillus micheneri TaxID=1899430 RepID=UPI00112D2F61|nr:NAD(P)-dependent oxidoreductase [Apilactobacillus micheneri]TPR39559.1 NAD(P)-dependent oxidoreductase [Apilactobacillus micheneri]
MKIGFIGTGVMGTGMINNLLKNNYEVKVFNRTKAHADTVIKNGANWNDSPKLVAENSDVVITIVGFPNDVEQVYFGDDGLLAGASKGEILIDSTTSKPKIDEKIYNESKKLGVEALDAPVSGGDVGAQNGNLTFMVGGDQAIFNKVKPVLNSMGSNIQIFGSAGKGQHTKMANQIMIAGNMIGLTEMLDYGKHADLDLSSLIKIVSQGGGDNWSLENYGPRVLKDDFKPGFAAKHFLKDLLIALECANEMHIDLPATKLAKQLYEKMVDQMDLGSDGTQGLIKLYK